MTVTPATLTTLSAAQTSTLSRAQNIVDAELRLQHNGPFPVKIRRGIIDFVFKENDQVLEALLESYRAAGWNIVTYSSSDQGDWFSFYPG